MRALKYSISLFVDWHVVLKCACVCILLDKNVLVHSNLHTTLELMQIQSLGFKLTEYISTHLFMEFNLYS